ncbi:MAG: rod shape-determining protein RodA [Deltaproteobacteria bacterium]|nr:rod shape-determining protein RodA [Deltaproteobacteria bacterium]
MAGSLVYNRRDEFDWVLVSVVFLISTIGILNLYSTGVASGAPELYLTQLYWVVLGGIGAFVVAIIDYKHYERYGYFAYGGGILMLVLVLLFGKEVGGSVRWFAIGEFRFQPSELMKVLLVVGLAKYLHHDPKAEGRKLEDLFVPALMTGLAMVLILKEPDLGTALLCLLVFLSIMMLTRLTFRSTMALIVSTPIVAIIGWSYLLKDYQKARVISFWNLFVDPEADKLGAGWHANQSIIAIGSGQLTGKGYLDGTAGPHHFLPECRTDFPFSVFAEEHGFLGAAGLVFLYLFLIMWCIRIAAQSRDRFGSVIAVGIGSIIFWHVVINLGMVMGVMPVVGITLPLFSYGGSSILTFMFGFGLLLNVSIHRYRRNYGA